MSENTSAAKPKMSHVAVEALAPPERQLCERRRKDPDDYVALIGTARKVNVRLTEDGMAHLTFTLVLPAQFFRMLADGAALPLGLPDLIKTRAFKAALGPVRPMIRLLFRKDALDPEAARPGQT